MSEYVPNFIYIFSGVGAMEIVAMDMKLRGMYIARQLSFQGIEWKKEIIMYTLEAWPYMNVPFMLDAPISRKQFFGL